MTPIIRKFVLKLLSKDRGSVITSLPGAQHRMIQESIITDTLLKKGVNPDTITSEGMLQSILNGIKKEEAMIARSKAEAQKQLATVMDMKGRKIRPGAKITGGEEVVETEAEIAERLGKGNKQAVENIKEKREGLMTNYNSLIDKRVELEKQLEITNALRPGFLN